METQSVRSWLNLGYQILKSVDIDDKVLSLQVLLAHHLKVNRSWLLAHPEAEISTHTLTSLNNDFKQLKNGYPLPYLLGHWEFFGHQFEISPHTLIPRPETELIVEHALIWLKSIKTPQKLRVIDIGTGSGCIPISILLAETNVHIFATDISYPALKMAQKNSRNLNVHQRISFLNADLLSFSLCHWNLVTANLPYIPTHKLSNLPVNVYEPTLALDGGIDGLTLIRTLFTQLANTLASPGLALLEFEIDQKKIIHEIATASFPDGKIELIKDLAGIHRILRIERS